MAFLLDTNVLSELRKGAGCHPRVRTWLEAQTSDDLYVGVLALAEIRDGIERLRPRDPQYAASLEAWLEEMAAHFGAHILTVTPKIGTGGDDYGLRSRFRISTG